MEVYDANSLMNRIIKTLRDIDKIDDTCDYNRLKKAVMNEGYSVGEFDTVINELIKRGQIFLEKEMGFKNRLIFLIDRGNQYF